MTIVLNLLSHKNNQLILMLSMLRDQAGTLILNKAEGYVNCPATILENEWHPWYHARVLTRIHNIFHVILGLEVLRRTTTYF